MAIKVDFHRNLLFDPKIGRWSWLCKLKAVIGFVIKGGCQSRKSIVGIGCVKIVVANDC